MEPMHNQCMTETQIPLHAKVRLRDDCHQIYAYAWGGSEGWVRKRRIADMGNFPMIWVEWDKKCWNYNGQEDGWTYESHFDIVEDWETPMVEDNNNENAQILAALGMIAKRFGGEIPADDPTAGNEEADAIGSMASESERSHYREVLTKATEHAIQADAFMVISVSKENGPENAPTMVPRMWRYALDPASDTLLDMQFSQIGAAAHQELGVEHLKRLLTAEDD